MIASQVGSEFLLEAEAVMIVDVIVDQTGHFSWWYDMEKMLNY